MSRHVPWVVCVVLVACGVTPSGSPQPGTGDDPAVGAVWPAGSEPHGLGGPRFACQNTAQSCAPRAEYCYGGAETAFYQGPGTAEVGCNQLPAECANDPSCACMFKFYPEGFCTCATEPGLTLYCSTI